jgi:hypothetical protein
MKKLALMVLLTIALSAVLAVPAAAEKKTELEHWQKTVEKVAPALGSDKNKGLCVCMGGTVDLEVGVIRSSVFPASGMGMSVVKAVCELPQFDTTTEKVVFYAGCSSNGGTWVPLVK